MKLAICLPGNSYSGKFLDSFIFFLVWCFERGIYVHYTRKESSVVYFARNLCLGANVLCGEFQKPWQGEIDYDYMLWIDSDIVFNPQDFSKLLEMNKDIASGLYLVDNGTLNPDRFATVVNWDEDFFSKNGYFEYLSKAEIQDKKDPFKVDYTGFGFMLLKKGVIENNITYPFFRPLYKRIGKCFDFTSEDVGFCHLAKQAGLEIWVNPQVIVGHEKKVILR